MVENRDANESPGLNEASSDFVVLVGRIEVAGRVIVRDDDCSGVVDDGAAENFARMDQAAIDDADSHDACGRDSVYAVETEREDVLPATGLVAFQDLVGVCRGANSDFVFDSSLRYDFELHVVSSAYQ